MASELRSGGACFAWKPVLVEPLLVSPLRHRQSSSSNMCGFVELSDVFLLSQDVAPAGVDSTF